VHGAILRGMTQIAFSVALFVLAGLAESAGATSCGCGGVTVSRGPWSAWCHDPRALRNNPNFPAGAFRARLCAYGGVFVVLSVLWEWAVDRVVPDRYDLIGALVCMFGVAIIMYAPRSH
jgi:small multidrug resistance family-3 protein